MTPKQAAYRVLEALPEDASWDDIHHEMLLVEKVNEGLEDERAGRLTDHETVVREMARRRAESGGRSKLKKT